MLRLEVFRRDGVMLASWRHLTVVGRRLGVLLVFRHGPCCHLLKVQALSCPDSGSGRLDCVDGIGQFFASSALRFCDGAIDIIVIGPLMPRTVSAKIISRANHARAVDCDTRRTTVAKELGGNTQAPV